MPPNSNESNADELEPPQWLNDDFFTKVLMHVEKNDKVKLKDLKISPATAKGDHYASIMFRCTVDYTLKNDESKSKSLILKTMPEMEGHKKEIFQDSYIFETEIGMYSKVVPKFKEILKAAGEDEITLGPPCLYHSLSPKKVIIFEDILPLGYVVQREQQQSLHEIKEAYEKLAKWHAVSHKILAEDPEFFEDYRYGIINMKSFYDVDTIKIGTTYFIEMLAEHEDLVAYKPYFEAFNKQDEQDLLRSAVASFNEYRKNPQENAIYALCHGDFHYKNMMYKRCPKTEQLLDLMLLDFQMCYVGPAVNDLIYSFYLLLDHPKRVENFDEILFCYFNKLKETLQKIDFKGKIPKMFDLRSQLMRHKNFELFLLTTFLPVWHSFRKGSYDGDTMKGDVQRNIYRNPEYLVEVRDLLPKYLHMGLLEQ